MKYFDIHSKHVNSFKLGRKTKMITVNELKNLRNTTRIIIYPLQYPLQAQIDSSIKSAMDTDNNTNSADIAHLFGCTLQLYFERKGKLSKKENHTPCMYGNIHKVVLWIDPTTFV